MALLDKEKIIGYRWKDFKKNYLKLNPKYKIVSKDGIEYGFKSGTKTAHWKYYIEDGEVHIANKMDARKVMTGKAEKDIFESLSQQYTTPTGKKHTAGNLPPYDPDAHVDRRDKDEEKFKALLTDLIKAELKKLSK